NPHLSASRLIGRRVEALTQGGSPRAGLPIRPWAPGTALRVDGRRRPPQRAPTPTAEDGRERRGQHRPTAERPRTGSSPGEGLDRSEEPLRRSATSEASAILADLVARDVQTLVFARSRRGAELVAGGARRLLNQQAEQALSPHLADRAARVAAYRGGYLASERRTL